MLFGMVLVMILLLQGQRTDTRQCAVRWPLVRLAASFAVCFPAETRAAFRFSRRRQGLSGKRAFVFLNWSSDVDSQCLDCCSRDPILGRSNARHTTRDGVVHCGLPSRLAGGRSVRSS